ncbi:Cyclin-dependent kinase F-3 [Apostasia shenzhenica]|uniref:cyclin-dependent kinase n=1 Tax=Apostasia shenzhenica TaxID=1088818 RepID=A0A2H9ZVV7_9ASPA|nr:Cyclin-dependent kinase F-3 [Apostasia shenzhenica]
MLIMLWVMFNHSHHETQTFDNFISFVLSSSSYTKPSKPHCLCPDFLPAQYRVIKEIGDGTCGSVYKALSLENNDIVAVKKMKRKFYYWEECMNLREVRLLQKLNHPNIVKLKEIVRENHELFLIFEHMECNLYHIMKDRQRHFSEQEIRTLMSQVLHGLAYMHRNGYFHRDLKPENLLVTKDIIKIADFGLAREVMSQPPFTDYVSTRWYRAPEVLLQSSFYTPAIDMWAVGAILAELFTLYPLFPGQSETDQLYKICAILGTPDGSTWPEGMDLSRAINFSFYQVLPANLSDIIPNASSDAIDLIRERAWVPSLRNSLPMESNQTGSNPKLELNLWDFGNESDDCFLGLTLAVKPSVSNPVFWPLIPRDTDMNDVPVMTSLTSSSYMVNSQTSSVPPVSISESSAFALSPLQPNLMDCHLFGPMMTLSSPIQQSLYFQLGGLIRQSSVSNAFTGAAPLNHVVNGVRYVSSSKLFVGGLSYGTDDMSLKEAFNCFGNVIEATVITDRDSGRSKGFGFVSFEDPEAARSAMSGMDGQELHGRNIRVSFANDRPPIGGGYRGGGGYGGGGYGG